MLIGEITNRVRNILSKGIPSDDDRFTSRFIYSIIQSYRASILKKQADNHKHLSESNYSTSICLKLTLDALFNCPCVTIDCKYPISVYNLPSLLSSNHGLLAEVRTVDGLKIDYINLDEARYNVYSRTKKDLQGFFIHDSKLVIVGNSRLKYAVVKGIFANPLALAELPNCNSTTGEDSQPCFSPLTQEFPMEEGLITDLLNMTFTEIIKIGVATRRDDSNDANSQSGPPDANQRIREF